MIVGEHLIDKIRKNKDNNKESKLRIPCEVYSRVVGYFRPVDNWNKGKQQEHKERVNFKIPENLNE